MVIETGIAMPTLAAMGFLFGALIGSFLNVVILRLPQQLQAEWKRDSRDFLGLQSEPETAITIAKPTSRCPACEVPIKPYHNIPLFSYFLLKGRCHACAAPISLQYPLVELAAGCLAAMLVYQFGLSSHTFYGLILSYCLIVLAGIDVHEKLLPDQITLPLLWLGLLANLEGRYVSLDEAVMGAIAGYLSLWLVFWGFKFVTGKEGMGYGDFKLLAALGAWLGWQLLPMVILISTAMALVVAISRIILEGRSRQAPMAFGPYLSLAGWIVFMWGDRIHAHYLLAFKF